MVTFVTYFTRYSITNAKRAIISASLRFFYLVRFFSFARLILWGTRRRKARKRDAKGTGGGRRVARERTRVSE